MRNLQMPPLSDFRKKQPVSIGTGALRPLTVAQENAQIGAIPIDAPPTDVIQTDVIQIGAGEIGNVLISMMRARHALAAVRIVNAIA